MQAQGEVTPGGESSRRGEEGPWPASTEGELHRNSRMQLLEQSVTQLMEASKVQMEILRELASPKTQGNIFSGERGNARSLVHGSLSKLEQTLKSPLACPQTIQFPAATLSNPLGFQGFSQGDGQWTTHVYSAADASPFRRIALKPSTISEISEGKYSHLNEFVISSGEPLSLPSLDSFDSWIGAFLNYTAVSVGMYPERSLELLAYASRIREHAKLFLWTAVSCYDVEFRRQSQLGAWSFAVERTDLFTQLLMPHVKSGRHGGLPKEGDTKDSKYKVQWLSIVPTTQEAICWSYNRGACKIEPCARQRSHVCAKCLGAHRATGCYAGEHPAAKQQLVKQNNK